MSSTTGLKKLFSPKSPTGSMVASVLVHVLIYGGLIGMLAINVGKKEKPAEDYIDFAYESVDLPPAPVEKPQHMAHANEPETQTDQKPDNTPHELQDEKSDVAGTQAAQKDSNVGSDANGTSATTPYYKIKPKYPQAALISGTEGWVLLEIDIKEDGTVDNVRVVDGEQRNMFQAEAKRAVAQYRYKPFVDSTGKPIAKKDWQVRVEFHLKDEEGS